MVANKSDNKIASPRLTGILQRERLFRSLDLGRERPALWVSGPGGAGKTTLVASYVAARELPALWYQLGEGDAAPATFFYNLGQAVKQTFPRSRKQLPLLSMEYLADLPAFARGYFAQLFQLMKESIVIVLDNFQHIPPVSTLHELLRVGIDSAPVGITFLLVSRDEPPAHYARLLANNLLSVINWQELRFDLDEARELLMVRGGQDLPERTVARLHGKAEGWAAGLILLIEHLRREKSDHDFLEDFTPDRISDYFASEVFDQVDDHTRDFLLKSSFLPRITIPLAEQLTGSPHCRLILSTLASNNYFTTSHQGSEAGYQYHQLFRDFLRTKAAALLPRDEVREIRKRAAKLLAEAGLIEDAGMIFGEIAAWGELSALALQLAPDLLAQGRSQLVEEWLTRLPEDALERDPWLLFWLGCATMTKGYATARVFLEKAFPLLDERRDATGAYLAWSGVVDTIVNEWADFERLDHWIEQLDRLRERYPEFPSRDIEGRVAGNILGALMFHLPQHPEIDSWAERIFILVRECNDPATRILTGHTLALYHLMWSGNHVRLGTVMDLLRPPGEGRSLPPLPQIIWVTLTGWQEWILGYSALAQKTFHEGLALSEESGVHVYDFMLYFVGILSYLDEGDFRTGGYYIEELFGRLDRAQQMNVVHCQYVAAWQAVLEGNIARARDHVSSALETAAKIGGPFTLASVWSAWTQVLYLSGQRDEARSANERAIQMARKNRCPLLLCRNLFVKAYYDYEDHDDACGLVTVREAFTLASPMRFMNFSWWHPAIMTRLCIRALEAGIEEEYVRELIVRRELLPEKPPLHLENWPWLLKVHTLGPFHLEKHGEEIQFTGKVQKKPLELLKALVALGGKETHEGQVADLLWPEADGDAARTSLKTTLHRLRQLIGHDEAVGVREGRLVIDRRYLYVDAWGFEHTLDEAERKREAGLIAEMETLTEKALALYRGSFLAGDDAPWLLARREKLAERYTAAVRTMGKILLERGECRAAISRFRQGLEKQPFSERLYRGLMECLLVAGDHAEAAVVYRRCRKMLAVNLGTAPSAATEELYRKATAAG